MNIYEILVSSLLYTNFSYTQKLNTVCTLGLYTAVFSGCVLYFDFYKSGAYIFMCMYVLCGLTRRYTLNIIQNTHHHST